MLADRDIGVLDLGQEILGLPFIQDSTRNDVRVERGGMGQFRSPNYP